MRILIVLGLVFILLSVLFALCFWTFLQGLFV